MEKREFGGEKIKIKAPHILFTKVQYLLWLKKYQKQGIGEVKFKNLKKWNQALFQEQPIYTIVIYFE